MKTLEDRAADALANTEKMQALGYGTVKGAEEGQRVLSAIYTDLRRLLRVPPGDPIGNHYQRIYDLAKP